MKRTVAGAAVTLALTLVPAGATAFAMGNPNTGQPGQSCQTVVATGGTEPGSASPKGGAATSPGSPFNEPNSATGNPGGTGGTAYNNGNANSPNTTNAISQYDVACFQVSQH